MEHNVWTLSVTSAIPFRFFIRKFGSTSWINHGSQTGKIYLVRRKMCFAQRDYRSNSSRRNRWRWNTAFAHIDIRYIWSSLKLIIAEMTFAENGSLKWRSLKWRSLKSLAPSNSRIQGTEWARRLQPRTERVLLLEDGTEGDMRLQTEMEETCWLHTGAEGVGRP